MAKLSKNKITQLSSLTQKKCRLKIYNDYTNFAKKDEKVIPKATMFKLMSHLTSSNKGILPAIDYINERLVNDPCEILQEVLDFSIFTTKI